MLERNSTKIIESSGTWRISIHFMRAGVGRGGGDRRGTICAYHKRNVEIGF